MSAKLQGTEEVRVILLEKQSWFSKFSKGRSCADNVHVIRQLIQKYNEFSQEIRILFIAYVKSSIKTQMFSDILYQKGFSDISLVKNAIRVT
jgi:hypothetical protein